MDRMTLILIVVVGTAAWYLYKRFVKKEPFRREPYSPPQPEVENWYNDTMSQIEALDEATEKQREEAWQAMSEEDQVAFSDKFMLDRFGQTAVNGYNRKQRLKIGRVHFLISQQ